MEDATAVAGTEFKVWLDEALAERDAKTERHSYTKYESRAAAAMIKRAAMPPSELCDHRFFQCRACGWNPYEPMIWLWFCKRSDDTRRELVRLSRKIRVKFFCLSDQKGNPCNEEEDVERQQYQHVEFPGGQ